MLKAALLAAAVLLPFAAYADEVKPCEDVSPNAFESMYPESSGVSVLAVGDVTKEHGDNVCSVIIDTTAGRARMVFTTKLLIDGQTSWNSISLRRISH